MLNPSHSVLRTLASRDDFSSTNFASRLPARSLPVPPRTMSRFLVQSWHLRRKCGKGAAKEVEGSCHRCRLHRSQSAKEELKPHIAFIKCYMLSEPVANKVQRKRTKLSFPTPFHGSEPQSSAILHRPDKLGGKEQHAGKCSLLDWRRLMN